MNQELLFRLIYCSWSRDGRYLLSSSQDWKCVLWDMKDGSRVRTVRFEAPVYIAELHPFNQYVSFSGRWSFAPPDVVNTLLDSHSLF
jgi:hypothetical protein